MKTRLTSLWLIVLALVLVLPQPGQAPVAVAAPRQASPVDDVTSADTYRIYLPVVRKDPPNCYTGESYGSFSPTGSDGGATNSYDKNLDKRGYTTDTTGSLAYTFLTGSSDTTAPRLYSLFSPAPSAPFAHIYNVGKAPWDTGFPGWLSDRMVGMAVTAGTLIRLPIRPNGDFPVAQPGGPGTTKYYGLVLYATASQVTVVYHSVDKIVNGSNLGYGLHVTKLCVDPNLVALYDSLDGAGRHQLPALTYNQAFGLANGTEVAAAITDSGSFMDPRAYKDWWR
jgi:hypothetical protein